MPGVPTTCKVRTVRWNRMASPGIIGKGRTGLYEKEVIVLPTKNDSGWTLVELMITISILAVMAGFAIPGIAAWLPDFRLKQAANDLFSNMQLTKLRAVKENKEWAIVFDNVSGKYFICSDWGADALWSTTDDNNIKRSVQLSDYESGMGYGHGPASINAETGDGVFPDDHIAYSGNVIVFNSIGTCNAGYIYFDHNPNTKAYAVGTKASGVIVLRKWTGTNWN